MIDAAISEPRFFCDAMCGGLARWLRALGYDTAYTPGIEDGDLVEQAAAQRRIVISGDTRMFERRALASGDVHGILLPHGLRLQDQVRFVVERAGLTSRQPRCMRCNGMLDSASRSQVADRVPAKSLLWATEFFVCRGCDGVFWNGTHWKRIQAVRESIRSSPAAACEATPHGLYSASAAGEAHAGL